MEKAPLGNESLRISNHIDAAQSRVVFSYRRHGPRKRLETHQEEGEEESARSMHRVHNQADGYVFKEQVEGKPAAYHTRQPWH